MSLSLDYALLWSATLGMTISGDRFRKQHPRAAVVKCYDESCCGMVIVEFARSDEVADLLRKAPASFEGYVADGKDGGFGIAAASDGLPGARDVSVLFTGGTYGAAAGPYLFHVGLPVPKDLRDEFLTWYHDEHLPILLESPDWNGCRFVEETVSNGLLFHALHQLSDRKALDSEERKRSRSTPWFERLSKNAWFDKGFLRTLYERASYS